MSLRQRELLKAFLAVLVAALFLIAVVAHADAAPVSKGERIVFEARIKNVTCILGAYCVGNVSGNYDGDFYGTVRGFRLRNGMATVTGTITFDGRIINAWARQ